MPYNPHLTVAAIIEQHGRFLLVEEDVEGQVVFNQPAGHVENGESLLQAVIRETLEETAHRFKPEAIIGIYRWVHPESGDTFFRHAFAGQSLGEVAGQTLDTGIIRAVWLSPDELRAQSDKLRSPLVLKTIEDYLQGQRYSLDLYNDVI